MFNKKRKSKINVKDIGNSQYGIYGIGIESIEYVLEVGVKGEYGLESIEYRGSDNISIGIT